MEEHKGLKPSKTLVGFESLRIGWNLVVQWKEDDRKVEERERLRSVLPVPPMA